MKIGEPGRQAAFDDPLEMLGACHERIADHCATLARLAAHLPDSIRPRTDCMRKKPSWR